MTSDRGKTTCLLPEAFFPPSTIYKVTEQKPQKAATFCLITTSEMEVHKHSSDLQCFTIQNSLIQTNDVTGVEREKEDHTQSLDFRETDPHPYHEHLLSIM